MATRPAGPSVIRREIEKRADYGDYRAELREDFWFSCAYCSLAEKEALGIGFEIDHYLPSSWRDDLEHSYGNLMWCCRHCNNWKLDSPTKQDYADGLLLLRPDEHDFRDHLKVENALLSSSTRIGKWTVVKLALNRSTLQIIRRQREELGFSRDLIANGLRSLAQFPIDQIHPAERALFVRERKRLGEASAQIEEHWKEELREALQSPLISQPDANFARLRRQELRELRVALAGPPPEEA